jgi:ABC-type lipoprotein export system ATPase subunit
MQISIKNLCFRHEKDYPLIEDLSYTFDSNKHYAIIGPSGCGKTTLLHLIAGLIQADSGLCQYAQSSDKTILPLFSFVFTRPFLIREISVYNNIVMGLDKKHIERSLLDSLVQRFNIESYLDYYPEQLSTGQQQRVAVIRALIRPSHFVIADEPAAHLDFERGSILMQEMQKVLKEQQRGLICVTHQLQWIAFFDSVIELIRSKIVEDRITKNES